MKDESSSKVLVSQADISGNITVTIEIQCRRCKNITTLVYDFLQSIDYCGHCEEVYEYHVTHASLFHLPEII